jgi:ribonuclease Z
MKIVLLGTGGPRPDPKRNASTTLIRLRDENILFDAGRGVVNQMVRADVPLNAVNPVFITHHHFDHIGDLYDVALATWMYGRKDALRIYGPPETRRIVDALLTQVYDKDWQWRSLGEPALGGWKPVVAEDVAPGLVLETDRWKVSADAAVHGDGLGLPPAFLKRWQCYGYRFEAEGKVVAISGDTIACEGIDRIARGVMQYTLAGGDTVGKIASRAKVKTLVLTHHRPRKDERMLDRLVEEVARDFSGRIIVGTDLTEIEL